MSTLRTQTQLVEFDPARAGVIGTIVDRAEFADTAARGEFPATFYLDLEGVEADGAEVSAHLALDWDRETLDQLLASNSDPELTLWFDRGELALAFDDVQAHGLKQKAAVIAVAVTAAGASATPALARIAPDVGGMGTAPSAHVQPSGAMGAVRGLQQDSQITVGTSQGTSVGTSEGTSSGGSGMSSAEIATIAGVGAVLISAAGFGVTRKRTHTVLPA
jgi:hypothetical protein